MISIMCWSTCRVMVPYYIIFGLGWTLIENKWFITQDFTWRYNAQNKVNKELKSVEDTNVCNAVCPVSNNIIETKLPFLQSGQKRYNISEGLQDPYFVMRRSSNCLRYGSVLNYHGLNGWMPPTLSNKCDSVILGLALSVWTALRLVIKRSCRESDCRGLGWMYLVI